jgi:hypothetical protein
MTKKEFKIGTVAKAETGDKQDYQYPKKKTKTVKGYSLSPINIEKLRRKAYWEAFKSESDLLDAILSKYFIESDYDPIPESPKV